MTGGKRIAVLVGCNYPNTSHALRGCINDVKVIKELLKTRFDFKETDITLLTDDHSNPSVMQPTGANILETLYNIPKNGCTNRGDLLLFYFSGHGTRYNFSLNSPNGDEEAIVATDNSCITRYDFRNIVIKMKEATLVVISDSCHSGGLIADGKVQVRDISTGHLAKTLDIRYLKQVLEVPPNTTFADHMNTKFKGKASIVFDPRVSFTAKSLEDMGILISGCRSEEVSYDVECGSGENKAYHGAFTWELLTILQQDPNPLNYKQVVTRVRTQLVNQHPCLYCSDENENTVFLNQQRAATSQITRPLQLRGSSSRTSAKHFTMGGVFEDITQVALGYYLKNSPESTRDKFSKWFDMLDHDEDGRVKPDIVYQVLINKKGCDPVTLCKFIGDTIGWETSVDKNQTLALYYVSRSFLKFCSKCDKCLWSLYFICVGCFNDKQKEKCLCAECYQEDGNECDQHGNLHFLDNHSLLMRYHFGEVYHNSKNKPLQNTSPETINELLEAAETSFKENASKGKSVGKDIPGSKFIDLDLGLKTDACSIM